MYYIAIYLLAFMNICMSRTIKVEPILVSMAVASCDHRSCSRVVICVPHSMPYFLLVSSTEKVGLRNKLSCTLGYVALRFRHDGFVKVHIFLQMSVTFLIVFAQERPFAHEAD